VIYFNLAATGDHIEREVKAPSNQREGDRSAHLSLKRVNSKEQRTQWQAACKCKGRNNLGWS
jgi:hypothetical protein